MSLQDNKCDACGQRVGRWLPYFISNGKGDFCNDCWGKGVREKPAPPNGGGGLFGDRGEGQMDHL